MAVSIFARVGTIKGESRDVKHPDEIEVLTWSWGVSQSGATTAGAGGGAGKASFQDLTLTHHVDKASPALMRACAAGEHIKDATIVLRKALQLRPQGEQSGLKAGIFLRRQPHRGRAARPVLR